MFILRIGAGSDDNVVHYENSLCLTYHACPLTPSPQSSHWFKSAIQPPQVCITWKECHIFPTCSMCAAKVLRFGGHNRFYNLKIGWDISFLGFSRMTKLLKDLIFHMLTVGGCHWQIGASWDWFIFWSHQVSFFHLHIQGEPKIHCAMCRWEDLKALGMGRWY